MPDNEPADENISPRPPSTFDREEGTHDPGVRSPSERRGRDKKGGGRVRDEDYDDEGRRRKRQEGA